MSEYHTTALYLFSALLQADAAIIGLGAIFVIYRLQALENRLTAACSICQNCPNNSVRIAAAEIESAKTLEDKREILDDLKRSGEVALEESAYFIQLEILIETPEGRKRIKNRLGLPVFLNGIHISLCAILLWLIPSIVATNSTWGTLCVAGIGGAMVLFFIIVIIVNVLFAKDMITGKHKEQ